MISGIVFSRERARGTPWRRRTVVAAPRRLEWPSAYRRGCPLTFPFRLRLAVGVGCPQPQAQVPSGGSVNLAGPVSFQSYLETLRTLKTRRSTADRIRAK